MTGWNDAEEGAARDEELAGHLVDRDFEPGEFDAVERRLSGGLTDHAAPIRPNDRLSAILHEAHEAHEISPVAASGGSGARRRWLPLAAAAAVVAIIGGVWWSAQDDGATISPPQSAGPSLSPAPSLPTPPASSPATTGTPTPSTSTNPVGTSPVALPVYFVGPIGDDPPTDKLFREFVRRDLPTDATPADRVKQALVLATAAPAGSGRDEYLQPWAGQTIGAVDVTADRITVDLADPGNPEAAISGESRRLAVQQLVWTAQAAVQQGNVPVRFTVQGSASALFGSISTDRSFTRPPSDRSDEDLAPIWVTSPTRDQVLPAADPVVVRGQASVFEGAVSWELERDGTTIRSGSTAATVGAPARGTFEVDFGRLDPGRYTVVASELSPKDGSVSARVSIDFTVS